MKSIDDQLTVIPGVGRGKPVLLVMMVVLVIVTSDYLSVIKVFTDP